MYGPTVKTFLAEPEFNKPQSGIIYNITVSFNTSTKGVFIHDNT